MMKHKVISKAMVTALSGFGPTYSELMADSDAYRSLYGSHVYVDVIYRRKRYLLKFCADYDIPGTVYMSDVSDVFSGDHWFASECARESYMDVYPLDWAWVSFPRSFLLLRSVS